MTKPLKLSTIPDHPTINKNKVIYATFYGSYGPCLEITCPFCKVTRLMPFRHFRQHAKSPNFLGACRPCYLSQPKAKNFRSSRNKEGRSFSYNGYIHLGKNAIPDEDLDMFIAMKRSGGSVLEHRWNMAKHLGRPLETTELVDHMDGNKCNNSIDNLRLYVRGKQQPGSAPGHGTYYHEWQQAVREISRLKHLLDSNNIQS